MDSGTSELPISEELLKILACPACDERPAVELTDDREYLKCAKCQRKYPIKDGIPVMLTDEAIIDGP